MLTDSHCHLDHSPLKLTEILAAAKEAQVKYLLTACVNLTSFPKNLAIAKANNNIFTSIGVHPTENDDHEASVDELVNLANNPLVVGIGETGLDNHHHDTTQELQIERFQKHIQAAKQVKKPLIIHTREAKIETMKILQSEGAKEVGGVAHCFSEDYDTAKQFLDMGFYISFSGILTYPAAENIREIAKKIPLDKILIETDSPYLAPQAKRGEVNQPAYVRYVAERLAEIREMSMEEIAAQTTANFLRLFKLPG